MPPYHQYLLFEVRLTGLQDSILERMTVADYEAATKPKVEGSWNLHQLLKNTHLDFFIMLSSLAGVFGHSSQSNYSAGGCFQDALAFYRNSQGLPAVSIDLGVVESIGYVAEHDGTAERMHKMGYTILRESDVLEAVESAMVSPFSGQILLGINTGPGQHMQETAMSRDARFSPLRYRELAHTLVSANLGFANSSDIGVKISQANTFEEAASAVAEAICKKVADIFMMEDGEVDVKKKLSDYGVDSLVVVEIRNMLTLRVGAEVSIFDIIQSTSISSLGSLVAAKSSHLSPSLLPS